jgi:patatin-like phospholipase/acyl hydrolase
MATPTANSKYLILACDGGGIRDLITALLLQQLSNEYPDFLKQTYLYAGTSTGGIISLALACNVSADNLVTLYSDGGQIFTKSACISGSPSVDKAATHSSFATRTKFPAGIPRRKGGLLTHEYWTPLPCQIRALLALP